MQKNATARYTGRWHNAQAGFQRILHVPLETTIGGESNTGGSRNHTSSSTGDSHGIPRRGHRGGRSLGGRSGRICGDVRSVGIPPRISPILPVRTNIFPGKSRGAKRGRKRNRHSCRANNLLDQIPKTYGDSEIRSTSRFEGPILKLSFSRNSFFSHRARRKREGPSRGANTAPLVFPAPTEKAARVKRKASRKRRMRLQNLQFLRASRCPQTALRALLPGGLDQRPTVSARCERQERRT